MSTTVIGSNSSPFGLSYHTTPINATPFTLTDQRDCSDEDRQEASAFSEGNQQAKLISVKEPARSCSPQQNVRASTVPMLSWRGLGGGKPTMRTIEFDKQLDKLAVWMEQWDHEERCKILERLLYFSNLKQHQFIWTVIQPAMHRDFMYTAKKEFPDQEFNPISIHASRKLKDKMMYMHKDNYHRVQSAHLLHYNQVQQLNQKTFVQETDLTAPPPPLRDNYATVLPDIVANYKSRRLQKLQMINNSTSLSQSVARPKAKKKHAQGLAAITSGTVNHLAKISGPYSIMFDGRHSDPLEFIKNAPPCIRFIEMPIRRHIQDEESPRVRELTNLSSLSIHNPSLASQASQLSLRERKKRMQEKQKSPEKKTHYKAVLHSMFSPKAAKLLNWYIDDWDDLQKNEFLHKFLIKLDPRQHYFISSFLSIKQYRDFISLLPQDLAFKILSYLRPRDIGTSCRVNRQWYKFCNDNELWRIKCMEVELQVPVPYHPDWKKLYKENRTLKTNWVSGKCNIIDCKGHRNKVLCANFDDTRLVTGSADKNIKVWNMFTGKCVQTLRGHVKGVWALEFFTNNLLISGSYDCTIKIWNLREGACTRTLLSHEGPVWCLSRQGNTLVSGSQDRTAKVWDVSKCLLLHTLRAHNAAVFCVDMDEEGQLILTGSADRSVRQWDAVNGKQLKIIWVSQTTSVMSVSYSQGFFVTSYGDTICLYKKNGKLVKTYQEHSGRIETVKLKVTDPVKVQGTMVSGGKDGSIKYWDLHKSRSVQSYRAHLQPVNCVCVNETRIVSAGYDNKMKIYDFNVES